MTLGDLIPETRIHCGAQAADWREAIQLLARMLADDLGVDFEPLRDALAAREKLGLTAIGNGIGFPHARSLEVGREVGALLLLREPLSTPTPDDEPVDLFVCYMSPTVGADIAPLARLARYLRDEGLLRKLRAAASPAQIHSILRDIAV